MTLKDNYASKYVIYATFDYLVVKTCALLIVASFFSAVAELLVIKSFDIRHRDGPPSRHNLRDMLSPLVYRLIGRASRVVAGITE